jgi:hypothetical protein
MGYPSALTGPVWWMIIPSGSMLFLYEIALTIAKVTTTQLAINNFQCRTPQCQLEPSLERSDEKSSRGKFNFFMVEISLFHRSCC